jgi:hypothetical protein
MAALYPRGKDPGTHWIGGWVACRADLDREARRKILCLWEGSNPDRPVVQTVVTHTILTELPRLPHVSVDLQTKIYGISTYVSFTEIFHTSQLMQLITMCDL